MFHARVGPMQLRSSSECQRYMINASLMLRTSGCMSYTLKVACRLNVRGVLQQSRPEIRRSRPRCVVGQPTCETVKVPIVNVHLAFIDHPTPKTLGHTSRSHGGALLLESLHTQHSGTDHQSVGRLSSSLPLQSDPYASTSPCALRTPQRALNARAPYASTSPCALRTPQRALNALSSTQMRSSSALDPTRFLAQSPSPPHQAR